MHIKEGDIVAVSHYSRIKPFKGFVLSTGNGVYSIKPDIDISIMSLSKGDPFVLGYKINDKVCVIGTHLMSNRNESNSLLISYEYQGNSESEEIAMSLYIDIIDSNEKKRYKAIIKSLGVYSVVICSALKFNFFDNFNIDIFLDKLVLFTTAKIVDCFETTTGYEYVLNIIHLDNTSRSLLRQYLKTYVNRQKQLLRNESNSHNCIV